MKRPKSEYSDVLMNNLPTDHTMRTKPAKIKFKKGLTVRPRYSSKVRRVPLFQAEEAKIMITEMVKAGVIGKEEGYTD